MTCRNMFSASAKAKTDRSGYQCSLAKGFSYAGRFMLCAFTRATTYVIRHVIN